MATTAMSRPAPAGDPKPERHVHRAERNAPLVVVIVLAVAFLLHSSTWLTSGFGESHDGRNAAVWAMSSRALRDDPIDSRLGGVLAPGYSYANHPPLIVLETAAAETIAGEHRVVTRSPAWLGSLVAIVLLCWLLLDAGLSRAAVAAGVTATFGSAMFLVYGSMLDTPVTSLPFTLGVLLAWQRARCGRPWPHLTTAAIALFASLASWQSFVFAVCATALLGVDAVRGRRAWRSAIALGAGATIGITMTFAWIHFVYGSFRPLQDNRNYRATGSGLLTTLDIQFGHLTDLMPIALLLGAAGAYFAVRDVRVRALFGLSTFVIAAYALMFRGAAEMHDYWNYAALIPVSVAIAAGADWLLQRVQHERRGTTAMALTLGSLACLVIALTSPSQAEHVLDNGLGTVPLARTATARTPGDGPHIAYISAGGSLSRWIDYETGAPGRPLHDVEELRAFAIVEPDFPVLVAVPLLPPERQAFVIDNAIGVEGPYALVAARIAVEAHS